MEIKYLGHASFLIKSKNTKLITDPFDPAMVGLKFPKVEADIVTLSHHHADHDRVDLIAPTSFGKPLIIDLPGEYEKMGAKITGFASYHDKKRGAERGENILFRIEMEGISLLHCGDLGVVPEENFLETIGQVDILFVPVGGFYTIDEAEAIELAKKIEPSIVIPMHYNHQKLNQQIFAKLSSVDEFLKKFGRENLAPVKKLLIKKEDLTEEIKIVLMEI